MKSFVISLCSLLLLTNTAFADKPNFHKEAHRKGVDPRILEGVCRYESDHGRVKVHLNKNGSWDVGYCQNHRGVSSRQPRVPANQASVKEAARELAYWKKQHERFCVNHYAVTGQCGFKQYGKWRGVKNCTRPHFWWSHYNHGFRVLKNNYGRKVACLIKNGYKKCTKPEWRAVKTTEPLFKHVKNAGATLSRPDGSESHRQSHQEL